MKNVLTLIAVLVSTLVANAQTIYSKAFGNSSDKPIIFLHGGPGYNSVAFEATTAKRLSENGFYVITYDRRGEGRSADGNAAYTFDETQKDLNALLDQYQLKSVTLVGHSFGGIIATMFAEKHPSKVESVILVGAPLSMQKTFATITESCKAIYQSKNDSMNLGYITMLENMDKSSLEYSSYCFTHAMQNGFYYPKQTSVEAMGIYQQFRTDSLLVKYSSQMSYEAPTGFWKNEQYTSLNLTEKLSQVVKNGTPIYGLYGTDDGLFSEAHVGEIKGIIGENNLNYLSNCSHNVFIDQQTTFVDAIKGWVK